ncbi:MAG: FAD-dependent thymidylate synthase [Chloroflexota bacterium]
MKVYAVVGVPPEVQAYAMAKYSRSAQSMLESISELSVQRAEQFLNTFYFQYGHRSIADLAHLVMGVEDVSILAAIKVVDEQLWDGQERSTRYQPFKKTGYFTPPELQGDARERYQQAADALFAAYDDLTKRLLAELVERVERPEGMDPKAFERTLRARAFDVSRGLLPLATITSLGQVVSARVLERQISRLLSDPLPEVQRIGAELKAACSRPAEQPLAARSAVLAAAGASANGHDADHVGLNGNGLNGNGKHARDGGSSSDDVRAAPTLVKYTAPSEYQIRTRGDLEVLAAELLASVGEPDRSRAVELGEPSTPEDEAVATLLYRHVRAGHSFRQVQAVVAALPAERKQEILDGAVAHRGPHDDLPRELQSGYGFAFDLLMDVGSFRDLHRHRRCVQIVQEPTPEHGAEPAREVFPRAFGSEIGRAALDAGLGEAYDRAVNVGLDAARGLAATDPDAAAYLLPLAARVRALFKMDAAQAVYIGELRTGEGGHFSYRRIAWEMYEALRERAPSLASLARPTPLADPPDLLRR